MEVVMIGLMILDFSFSVRGLKGEKAQGPVENLRKQIDL